jgi:flagellar biosynthesis/type III secretory pathway protein FliH
MSTFVPMRGARPFSLGALGGGEGPGLEPESDGFAVASSALPEPPSPLPDTEEALDVLLDGAREQARADAGAVLAELKAEIESERQQLVALQKRIIEGRKAWAEQVRNMLGELVVVGVRQVVSESASLQEELLRDRFAEIGERLIGEHDILIRVRPEDEDAARALVGDREGWKIVPDADLGGGAVAETAAGKIDATLGAALSGLADSVREWQAEGVGEEE